MKIPTSKTLELASKLTEAEKDRDRYKHERDCLAKAIGDAAVGSGLVRNDVDLTGPQLMLCCQDMADYIKKLSLAHGDSQ